MRPGPRALKWIAIALAAYVGLVAAFELLVGFMGKRQAANPARMNESFIVVTTADAAGSRDTVVAGVEIDGQLYVAANHWPRGWYHRALANPEIEVTRAGQKTPYRAVPLDGADAARIADRYRLPFAIRFLTGFPPRSFLRLDPR